MNLSPAHKRDRAAGSAGMSLLVPGLGQLLQRRFAAAAIQLGAVLTYVIATTGAGWGRAAFLAVAWKYLVGCGCLLARPPLRADDPLPTSR